MSPDKLVYMANQIGKFFANQGEEKAVRGADRPSDEVLAPAHACRDYQVHHRWRGQVKAVRPRSSAPSRMGVPNLGQ
jgi:hypothetical protein